MATMTGMIERHLRVEVVDESHRDWPAVRRQIERSGGAAHLREVGGRLSARQAVVAAFLQGRAVAHTAFHVAPLPRHGVVAQLDSHAVDAPFAGTAVEQVLDAMARSRARTMGCLADEIAPPADPPRRRAA